MEDGEPAGELVSGGAFVRRDRNRASLLALSVLTAIIALLHLVDVLSFFHPAFFILIAVVSAVGALIAPGPAGVTAGGIVLPLSWASRLRGAKPYLDMDDIVRARASKDIDGLLELRDRDGKTYDVYLGRDPRVPSVMAYVIARVEVQEELRREARRGGRKGGKKRGKEGGKKRGKEGGKRKGKKGGKKKGK